MKYNCFYTNFSKKISKNKLYFKDEFLVIENNFSLIYIFFLKKRKKKFHQNKSIELNYQAKGITLSLRDSHHNFSVCIYIKCQINLVH